MAPAPMSLMAKDEADLAIVAAALQDAILPPREMEYSPTERRFALLVNRFRWECAPARSGSLPEDSARDASFADTVPDTAAERVMSLLVIERVRAVRRRNLESRPASGFFSLLTIALDRSAAAPKTGCALDLVFAGGARIRVEVEAIAVYLRDVGASWPTASRPRHEVDRS